MRSRGLFLIVVLAPVVAVAQEPANFGLDRFAPGMDREAVIGLDVASQPLHLDYDAYLWLGYAHNLLMVVNVGEGDRERLGALVGRRFTGHIGGALSLFDLVQIGLDAPVIFYQGRGSPPADRDASLSDLSVAGFGELRLTLKVPLVSADLLGVDVALLPIVTFPTGVPARAYLSDRSLTVTPALLVSRALGMVRATGQFGWRWRRAYDFLDATIGPELVFGAGAAVDLETVAGLPLEIATAIQGTTLASEPFGASNETPLELFLQGGYRLADDLQLFAGAAFGLVAGLGTPDFRVLAGVRLAPRGRDRDKDRVPDAVDKCADVPEDHDGFEDEDGCPDEDNDQDGIADSDDACPDEPESQNDIEDEDGCPEEQHVALSAERIEISDTVHFRSGSAEIRRISYSLLIEVAEILKKNQQIKKVRIEGHTDNVGGKAYNKNLSQRRAESVRTFLVKQGVVEERLEAVGFGGGQPIAPNSTARGRARNRRVEFLIADVEK